MGMLVEGKWQDVRHAGSDGTFKRLDSVFRERVSKGGATGFAAMPGAIISMFPTPAPGRRAR